MKTNFVAGVLVIAILVGLYFIGNKDEYVQEEEYIEEIASNNETEVLVIDTSLIENENTDQIELAVESENNEEVEDVEDLVEDAENAAIASESFKDKFDNDFQKFSQENLSLDEKNKLEISLEYIKNAEKNYPKNWINKLDNKFDITKSKSQIATLRGENVTGLNLTIFVNDETSEKLPFKKIFKLKFEGKTYDVQIIKKHNFEENSINLQKRIVFAMSINNKDIHTNTLKNLSEIDLIKEFVK